MTHSISGNYYIACDLGAESGRVMLGHFEGGRVELEEMHRFTNGPVRVLGSLRWDVLRIFAELKIGLSKVAARAVPITSLSVDAWGVDYVLIRGCQPMLALPYNYRDSRTDGVYERAHCLAGDGMIFEQTGIQSMSINTLYQLIADAEQDGALLESADCFLTIGDYFHYLFCGKICVDESLASTTQIYDTRTRRWSDSLIDLFGLPKKIFPQVVPCGTTLAPMLPEICEETGLAAGVEVIATCSHDTGAAVAAVPAQGDDWAYLSSGTWSLIGVELAAPLVTPEAAKLNFTNEAGYAGTTRFLKNIVGLWILQECRRSWNQAGREWSYDELVRAAEDAPPLRSLISPNHPRFVKPDRMPEKIREFCTETGQPVPETEGQTVRCILESLALVYRTMLDSIERLTNRPIRVLHIVGGGSRNRLLNQLAANATGRPVHAGPMEATALGNVLLQAVAAEHLGSLAELRATVRRSSTIETFSPEAPDTWAAAYERFEQCIILGEAKAL